LKKKLLKSLLLDNGKIPIEFRFVDLALATHWDYWTLRSQPSSFILLLEMYLHTQGEVEAYKAKGAYGRKQTTDIG